ncbi:hypothetical protein IQ235_05730 [Oscillatoriales cyanobacterium LEGE 11467]|uniref:Uncharacterized protein n=1 Tax=Zarconia navalis LEGE 11467 TaxID=1828826 RepID=A0A928VXX5_9CYAN|nr:hypothetical protein [Zarconia navalis]MBE9040291.1 hypothetical protein [Zarconia navalis LEGE 11467]
MNTNKLDIAVEKIKRHPNQVRIKKILWCACENKWENNILKIQKVNTKNLIKRLLQKISDLEELNFKFIRIVGKINKKSLYFSLSNQVLNILRPIYRQNYTTNSLNQVHIYLKNNHQKIKYQNLFNLNFLVDLKFTVSRNTNLHQAKVLIHSALYYKFDRTVRDWDLLNNQEFDDLVRVFCHSCETLEEIEFRLEGAAYYLDKAKNNIEVARTIVQSIRRFYNHVQKQEKDNIILMEDITFKTELSSIDNEEDEEKTLSDNFFVSNSWDFECGREETERKKGLSPELERRIEELSKTKVDSLMLQVETRLQELENYLEQNIKDYKPEEYSILKYRVLRDFMQDFQLASTKYLGILQTLEQNDRQK